MKKNILVLLIACFLLFSFPSLVSADETLHPSQLIGTVSEYLNQVRELPAAINDALCEKDEEAYRQRLQELATAISNAAATIQQMRMDIPFGFWNVYTVITANPVCGIGQQATGAADLAREKWDTQTAAAGLTGNKNCPVSPHKGMNLTDAQRLFGFENNRIAQEFIDWVGDDIVLENFDFTDDCNLIVNTVLADLGSGMQEYYWTGWDDELP